MKRAAPTSLKKHIRESPEILKLRRKRKLVRARFLSFFGILFLLLIGGFIYAARYPKFQITTITVTGNLITDSADIASRVSPFLSGNYFYLIPRRNAYLYPKHAIIADLEQSFPRLQSVSVYRTNLHTIAVSVSEVHVIALWCGEDTTVIDATVPCYFTDNNGKVIAPAPYYSGNVYTRFFGGTLISQNQDPIGRQFLPSDQFASMLSFAQHVIDLGLQVRAVSIGTGTANEDDMILDLGSGKTAPIRFLPSDNPDDYRTLAANLSAALGKPELAAQFKKDAADLEYLDLRFTDKVYYKFAAATSSK